VVNGRVPRAPSSGAFGESLFWQNERCRDVGSDIWRSFMVDRARTFFRYRHAFAGPVEMDFVSVLGVLFMCCRDVVLLVSNI